jgi:hypothetical protein
MIALRNTAERTKDHYHADNYVFQRHLFAYETVMQKQLLGKRVLELGCGSGYGMRMLAPHTDIYLGIDKDAPLENSIKDGSNFMQASLRRLVEADRHPKFTIQATSQLVKNTL